MGISCMCNVEETGACKEQVVGACWMYEIQELAMTAMMSWSGRGMSEHTTKTLLRTLGANMKRTGQADRRWWQAHASLFSR